jgi:hypothetical protein
MARFTVERPVSDQEVQEFSREFAILRVMEFQNKGELTSEVRAALRMVSASSPGPSLEQTA